MECYNCGRQLQPNDNHKEHIPAKNLFDGFPENYKTNRITVPACYQCNQSYSIADEEFRNLIGFINKHPDSLKLTEKATRSMSRLDSKLARIIYNIFSRKPYAAKFDMKQIKSFHIKNFKGLFYHHYNYPVPNNYRIIAHIDNNYQTSTSQCIFSSKCTSHSYESVPPILRQN